MASVAGANVLKGEGRPLSLGPNLNVCYVIVSGKALSYKLHSLLQFCDGIDNIATLTLVRAVSAFGTLSVKDKSLGVEALIRIKVVIISSLRAHHTELYLSLCWTSGRDPPSCLVRGFRLTANMRGQCDCYSKIYAHCHRQIRKSSANHRHERAPYRNQLPAG